MKRNKVLLISLGGLSTLGVSLCFIPSQGGSGRSSTSFPPRIPQATANRHMRTLTATPPELGTVTSSMRTQDAIYAAIEARRPDRAETLLNAHLKDSEIGRSTMMRELRVQLLAARGSDAQTLSETLNLLRGGYGPWQPDARKLRYGLVAAIRLGARDEADEIATAIIAKRDWQFSNYPDLYTPTTGQTPAQRLAYAYLSLSHEADWDGDRQAQVLYGEKAQALAPGDAVVLTQLASAYQDRMGKGDRERAVGLLKRAYRSLPPNSSVRRDVRLFASDIVDVDPNSSVSLQEELTRANLVEHRIQVERAEGDMSATNHASPIRVVPKPDVQFSSPRRRR